MITVRLFSVIYIFMQKTLIFFRHVSNLYFNLVNYRIALPPQAKLFKLNNLLRKKELK